MMGPRGQRLASLSKVFFPLLFFQVPRVAAWCPPPPLWLLSGNSCTTTTTSGSTAHHLHLYSSSWGREEWGTNNRNDDVDTSKEFESATAASSSSSSSVGDYVKGVHGGKYQFSAAGLNTAGQEFAETGYGASNAVVYNNPDDHHTDKKANMPQWARRLGVTLDREELERRAGMLRAIMVGCKGSDGGAGGTAFAEVQNQERTWEPFYVKIMRIREGDTVVEEASSSSPFVATPLKGKLAPFGGANNPYNPAEPFSDSVRVEVTVNRDYNPSLVAGPHPQGDYYLVIGTEEEQWYYGLVCP